MGGDIAETVIQTDRPELPNALIFGDSFTWAAAKALLMERRREQDRNKTLRVDFSRKAHSAA